jgi:hypothetical protein
VNKLRFSHSSSVYNLLLFALALAVVYSPAQLFFFLHLLSALFPQILGGSQKRLSFSFLMVHMANALLHILAHDCMKRDGMDERE